MVSGWNMVTIFILLKNRYETDSTSIGVSTAYSRWTNTFPSIGVCLSKSRINKEFTEAVQRRFPGKKQPYTYTRTLYDYLFITPNNLYIKPEYSSLDKHRNLRLVFQPPKLYNYEVKSQYI